MNGNDALLDTNILVAILNADNKVLKKSRERKKFVPSIAIGELVYGIHRSSHKDENMRNLIHYLKYCRILPVDARTAFVFGRIKASLSLKGSPIPINDLWIASLAMQYDLTLITHDRHFDSVPGLKKEDWLE